MAHPMHAHEQAAPEGLRRSLAGLELALIRHRRTVRQRLGVSDEELTVLLHLAFEGGAPLARLVTLTTLSRSGMGALVQRLEEAGLVKRRTDAGDRRLRLVALTAAGAQRLEQAYGDRDEAVQRRSAQLPAGELAALGHLLDALTDAAQAGEAPAPAVAPESGPETPLWRRWG